SRRPDPDKEISLADAYSVITPNDNKRLYAQWAKTYDTSFVEANRYRYPRGVAEHFAAVVPGSVGEYFVDVGCGTGIVGSCLASFRPTCRIDGFDISPEMLAQAHKKLRDDGSPVYSTLYEVDLTQPLKVPTGEYDALVSAGTFTHGHLGPDAFQNLLPLVRIGGWFVIGINAEHFALHGFGDMLAKEASRQQITPPELHKIQVYEEGSRHFGDQAVIATFRRVVHDEHL
ncbi:MAG: class I SAM-dependent methyltransferase, partial [Actinomycetota bacterium]